MSFHRSISLYSAAVPQCTSALPILMILLQLVPEILTWLLMAASDQEPLLQIILRILPCCFKRFYCFVCLWHMLHYLCSLCLIFVVIMLVQALCQWHSLLYQDFSQVPIGTEISLVVHCYQTVLWGLVVLKKEEDISRCGLIGCRDMSFSLMVSYNQEMT